MEARRTRYWSDVSQRWGRSRRRAAAYHDCTSVGSARLVFSFEAVIIGGLGSMWGTLAGGIVLGIAQAVGAAIDPSLGVLSGHIVFLVVLAVRPTGIAGARANA